MRTRARRNTTVDRPAPDNNAFGKPTGLRRSVRPAAAAANANIKTHAHAKASRPDDATDNAGEDAQLPEAQDCNVLPSIEDNPFTNEPIEVPDSDADDEPRSFTSGFEVLKTRVVAIPAPRNHGAPELIPSAATLAPASTKRAKKTRKIQASRTTTQAPSVGKSANKVPHTPMPVQESANVAWSTRNAAENDVELYKLMLQGVETLAVDNLGYDERFRIWNNLAVEACETKDFRRNFKHFLAQNNDFLDKYGRYNQIRDREQLVWDQETKQRQVPEKAVGSLIMMIDNIKTSLDHNIALLDQMQLEYRAPDLETLTGIPIRQTMARTKLAEAEDRLAAAQEWVDGLIWRVDKSYPEWYWKWKKSAPDALQ
ncbi:hypothetical protein CT0861_01909 [Colletotrichum tofieldiae]|uniref:Uncharacterized protein n=1 Tax=Colletotrichum tofieldiae TaxID=708197 RepID=A0A166P8R4_9PEZI|nr:hypothetical protein CT0861_01909 [Colletotrichum tofieldiae]